MFTRRAPENPFIPAPEPERELPATRDARLAAERAQQEKSLVAVRARQEEGLRLQREKLARHREYQDWRRVIADDAQATNQAIVQAVADRDLEAALAGAARIAGLNTVARTIDEHIRREFSGMQLFGAERI